MVSQYGGYLACGPQAGLAAAEKLLAGAKIACESMEIATTVDKIGKLRAAIDLIVNEIEG